jgi:integrase
VVKKLLKTHKCPTCGAPVLFAIASEEYDLKKGLLSWIDGLELEGKSYAYTYHLRQRSRDYIIPFFRKLRVLDIRAIRTYHIHSLYHALLKKRLSSKTVKHILDTLKTFLNYQYSIEKIDVLPRFPKVKVTPKKPKGWIDREMQEKVISEMPFEHHLIFQVLCETGIRPGEVCALKKKDIQDGGLWIERAFDEKGFLKETKTGNSYLRPISEGLYNRLLEHARFLFPEDFLFRHKGEPYNRRLLYRLWVRAASKVGVKITPYQGSRHSRVSQLRKELENRMHEQLRKELGHSSSITTLRHYALNQKQELR